MATRNNPLQQGASGKIGGYVAYTVGKWEACTSKKKEKPPRGTHKQEGKDE